MGTIREQAQFFKRALLGKNVGAIATSSDYLIDSVARHIEGPLNLVVEYGPGDGAMTRAILDRLSPEGKLFVIESDSGFAEALRKISDSRLRVIEGYVPGEIVKGRESFTGADLIISSVPLSLLKPEERDEIAKETYHLLAPHGSFIVFHQYSKLVEKYLKKYFSRIDVSFEFRNVFPCFIFRARK